MKLSPGIKGDDYYAVWSMVHWNGGVLARTLSQKTTHLIVGANQSLVSCNLDPFIIREHGGVNLS